MAEPTLLAVALLAPLAAAVAMPLLGGERAGRAVALGTMLAVAWLIGRLFVEFDGASGVAQFAVRAPLLPALGTSLHFAMDGYNAFLALLCAVLFPVVLACAWPTPEARSPLFLSLLLVLESTLLGTFLAQDLLVFFVLWEAVLLPTVLLILVFGGPQRRKAALSFFLYTMAGSVALLAAVIWLGVEGARQTAQWSFEYATLGALQLTPAQQAFLFAAIALACAVKSPLVPFHSWLPLAYVESPTPVTAIMAGVMSKMGAYGFLRLALPLAPDAVARFAPWFVALAVASLLYGALLALRERHAKRLVAYASLSHMGYVALGIFSLQATGLHGAWLQVLSHGFVVAGLFLVLGLLEQRRGTAYLQVHGLAARAPALAVVLMLFVLASLALPLTSGFAAEFMVLLGAFGSGYAHWQAGAGAGLLIAALLAATGVVLGAAYMLRFARSLVFDDSAVADAPLRDLRARELAALVPLLLLVLWIGVRPATWTALTEATVARIAQPAPHVAAEVRHAP